MKFTRHAVNVSLHMRYAVVKSLNGDFKYILCRDDVYREFENIILAYQELIKLPHNLVGFRLCQKLFHPSWRG
jgi:hypothetical protein